MKFRLKRGKHHASKKIGGARQTVSWHPGDVIESEADLVKMHGHEKFELVSPETEAHPGRVLNTVTPDRVAKPESEETVDDTADTLNEMTVAELRKFADSESIHLGGATTKAEIIKAIRAANSDE